LATICGSTSPSRSWRSFAVGVDELSVSMYGELASELELAIGVTFLQA
jgi:hypothetical protein